MRLLQKLHNLMGIFLCVCMLGACCLYTTCVWNFYVSGQFARYLHSVCCWRTKMKTKNVNRLNCNICDWIYMWSVWSFGQENCLINDELMWCAPTPTPHTCTYGHTISHTSDTLQVTQQPVTYINLVKQDLRLDVRYHWYSPVINNNQGTLGYTPVIRHINNSKW